MSKKAPFYFVLPFLILFLIRVLVPFITAIAYSFYSTDGIMNMRFIGFENYVRMFTDSDFWHSSLVTLKYSVLMVAAGQIISLLLALMIFSNTKLNVFLRSMFYIPCVLSMVAVAFIWKIIFSYDGPLDTILQGLGLDFLIQGWLTDPEFALYSIVAVGVFKGAGVGMILYLTALLSVPSEVYESCELDGARGLSKFFFVTLPLILPGISVAVISATINNLKEFEKMMILTNGGPVDSTNTLGFYIMTKGVGTAWVGYACAMSVLLFIVIGTITYFQNKFFDEKSTSY